MVWSTSVDDRPAEPLDEKVRGVLALEVDRVDELVQESPLRLALF